MRGRGGVRREEGEAGEDNNVFVCVCIREGENRRRRKRVLESVRDREKAIVVIMIPSGLRGLG